MAQTFSSSEQGLISINAGNNAAGTKITLTDQNGKVILEHSPALSFSVVILSSPEMVPGQTYTVTVGSQSADFTAS